MTAYMIGVDIGTTSTKAVLFTYEGEIIEQSSVEYSLITDAPGKAEQNPDEILCAIKQVIKHVMVLSRIKPSDLRFISFGAAMHSLILVDEDNQLLTHSITWADQRSQPYAQKLKEENGHDLYLKTGTPIHPMSPLSKLLWIKEEHPELFSKAAKFIGIKEYIFKHFFGNYVSDYSIASATGLMNMNTLDWDKECLQVAGISATQLPKIVPTTEIYSGLNKNTAEEMNISPDTPFIIGANDGCLANLGVGAIEEGVVALTIGTSGAIRTMSPKPISDPKGRTFSYALTDSHWIVGGAVNNGGLVMKWLKDELALKEVRQSQEHGQNPYDLITDTINQLAPGSDGLLFTPYLTGERAPYWNANLRGSFFGLSIHHSREHMMRAVLEGINMNLYTVLLALEELIGIPERIHATGGFAKSNVWRQMVADIFNLQVHVPQTVESACFGAAFLGLYAVGEVGSLSDVTHYIQTHHVSHPIKENVTIYKELIPLFIRLNRRLEDEYDSIVAFQRKYSHLTNPNL